MKREVEYYLPKEYKYDKCVMFVICPQHEGSIGGSDAQVRDLAKELIRSHSSYTPIVLFYYNKEYRNTLNEMNIPYVFAHGCKNKFQVVKALKDFLDRVNLSIIHSHQYDANYLTEMLVKFNKGKWKDIPIIMTCHGWVENTLKLKIMTYFDFKSYLYSKGLIAVSVKDFNRLNNTKMVDHIEKRYIPNGIVHDKDYSKEEKDAIYKEYNLPKDKYLVGYVGRLSSEKRIDLVIEVAKETVKKNKNIVFVICGNGAEKEMMLSKIEEYHLEDNVKYLGFIKEISKIHSILDVILITSDTEGTPRAVLESMSYGSICVSTLVGGLKEIITGNNGYLSAAGDVDSLTNNILKSYNLNDKERKEIISNSINTVNEKFTIEKMTKEVVKFYDDIRGNL